jgi:hypothetical protein
MFLNQKHFNGWDWTELVKAWNVYIPDYFHYGNDFGVKYGYHETCTEYDPIKWLIFSALSKYDGNKSTRPMRKMAQDCREYLALLGNPDNCYSYSGPMWLGMSKIEDDWTLLWMVYTNIAMMWN